MLMGPSILDWKPAHDFIGIRTCNLLRNVGSGPLREIARLFLRLGVVGFGGPAAHIALMEDAVVHRRKWVKRQHFLDALSVTNMVPGPNSTELAIHVGYLRAGVLGGLVSGTCFILPAFLLMLALSWAYFEFGSVPQVVWLFYGVKPAIIAIIAATAYRLSGSAISDWRQRVLASAALAVTVVVPGLTVAALIVAGLLGIALYSERSFRFPGAGLLAGAYAATPMISIAGLSTLLALGWVFLKASALLFGGGFVIIPTDRARGRERIWMALGSTVYRRGSDWPGHARPNRHYGGVRGLRSGRTGRGRGCDGGDILAGFCDRTGRHRALLGALSPVGDGPRVPQGNECGGDRNDPRCRDLADGGRRS